MGPAAVFIFFLGAIETRMSYGLRGLTTLQYLGGSLGAHKGLHGNNLEVKIDIYHTRRISVTFIYSHWFYLFFFGLYMLVLYFPPHFAF